MKATKDDLLYVPNYNARYALHLEDLANQTSFKGTNDINIESAKKSLKGVKKIINKNKKINDKIRIGE